QSIPERIKRCDHVRTCVCQRLHVRPLGDDAIRALAGLYHVRVFEAGPANVLVGVDEILITPGLHPEAYRVECSHDVALPCAVANGRLAKRDHRYFGAPRKLRPALNLDVRLGVTRRPLSGQIAWPLSSPKQTSRIDEHAS
ncbi:hypothetical protein chiPu_0030656, partial [Chiloscyllium punctatum]|nr:hypothetical protein [Chiloscyllium punctatum]